MNKIDVISTPQKKNEKLETIYSWLKEIKGVDLPTTEMMKIIGSSDKEHFITVIKQIFSDLLLTSNCNENSNIIDLGCGCGRMAMPFTQIITNGEYNGYDVWEEGINWCKENLLTKNNCFNFTLLNAQNNYYFDDDNNGNNNFKFHNIKDTNIDFIFAISVFTHLNPNDTLQYFKEFSRILKPNAKAYITSFIIDEEFFEFVEKTKQHTQVKEKEKGYYSAYSKQYYLGGYTMELWKQLLNDANLEIVGYEPGSWAQKKNAKRYQDTFLIQKISH